jgi:hypothetical protein
VTACQHATVSIVVDHCMIAGVEWSELETFGSIIFSTIRIEMLWIAIFFVLNPFKCLVLYTGVGNGRLMICLVSLRS